MKKSIIALMGLFMLVACSEDVYQEADQMSESGNVENTDSQIQVYTHDPSIPYDSPYDLSSDRPFTYIFRNNTDIQLQFHPFISLCYYDGANDGVHFGQNLSATNGVLPIYPRFTVLPNWNEYDTHVTSQMIIIPPFITETITTLPGSMNLPADPSGPKTASGQFFDFTASSATPQEIALYTQFGKFIGLESNIGTIQFAFLNNSNPGPGWSAVPPSSPSSLINKVYNTQSLEVCTISGGIANYPTTYTKIINGKSYTISAYTTPTQVVVELN